MEPGTFVFLTILIGGASIAVFSGFFLSGLMETCKDEDMRFDENCVKRVLRQRELREAPDITSHLKEIESRVQKKVLSETESCERKVDDDLEMSKLKIEKHFMEWEKKMNRELLRSEYLMKVAAHIPAPVKQFTSSEESALREWAALPTAFTYLLHEIQLPLKTIKELNFNKSVLYELKCLSEDSRQFSGDSDRSGLGSKIESLEEDISLLKEEIKSLNRHYELLLDKYYYLQATYDTQGGKGLNVLGLAGIAVIAIISLLFSIQNRLVMQQDNRLKTDECSQTSTFETPSANIVSATVLQRANEKSEIYLSKTRDEKGHAEDHRHGSDIKSTD